MRIPFSLFCLFAKLPNCCRRCWKRRQIGKLSFYIDFALARYLSETNKKERDVHVVCETPTKLVETK